MLAPLDLIIRRNTYLRELRVDQSMCGTWVPSKPRSWKDTRRASQVLRSRSSQISSPQVQTIPPSKFGTWEPIVASPFLRSRGTLMPLRMSRSLQMERGLLLEVLMGRSKYGRLWAAKSWRSFPCTTRAPNTSSHASISILRPWLWERVQPTKLSNTGTSSHSTRFAVRRWTRRRSTICAFMKRMLIFFLPPPMTTFGSGMLRPINSWTVSASRQEQSLIWRSPHTPETVASFWFQRFKRRPFRSTFRTWPTSTLMSQLTCFRRKSNQTTNNISSRTTSKIFLTNYPKHKSRTSLSRTSLCRIKLRRLKRMVIPCQGWPTSRLPRTSQ